MLTQKVLAIGVEGAPSSSLARAPKLGHDYSGHARQPVCARAAPAELLYSVFGSFQGVIGRGGVFTDRMDLGGLNCFFRSLTAIDLRLS